MKRLILSLVIVLAATSASAQNLVLYNVDVSNFPKITAQCFTFDANGNLQSPQPSDFTVSENGITRSPTAVTCAPSQNPTAISAALVIDVSSSVTKLINGITAETLEQQGTSAFVSALDLTKSECSFTTFANLGHLHSDFRTDRAKLLGIIQDLSPGGGTDYNYAFQKPVAGGLFILNEAKHKPILVMSTDGVLKFRSTPQQSLPKRRRRIARSIALPCA